MKNVIKNFGQFINEEESVDVYTSQNRDKMVYLIPRTYKIIVDVSPEYTEDGAQAKSEMMLTSKFSGFANGNRIKFNKRDGVNIIGSRAYLKLKSVFTEDDIRLFVERLFGEMLDGEIKIKEGHDEEFNDGKYFFSNENKNNMDVETADIHLEFDWTWADQMSKTEAAKALADDFDRIGFPNGLKLVGKPRLDGWGNRGGSPKYNRPYEAEFSVSFTGSRAEVKKWAKKIQLGDTTVEFNTRAV
jgi:hypothetical protein